MCQLVRKLSSGHRTKKGLPNGSEGKESTCNARDLGTIPEFGRSPGEWNGNPLQYSCLGKSKDRGALRATVHGVTKSWTWLKRLIMQTCWIIDKAGTSRETSTSASLITWKPLTVCITTNCGKFLNRILGICGNTRPPDLPPEKSICRSRINS